MEQMWFRSFYKFCHFSQQRLYAQQTPYGPSGLDQKHNSWASHTKFHPFTAYIKCNRWPNYKTKKYDLI